MRSASAVVIAHVAFIGVGGIPSGAYALTKMEQAKVYEQLAGSRAQELGNIQVALDAKLQLGRILFNMKDYAGAVGQMDAYIAESSNTVRVAEALYESGLALYNQQFYSEAIERWTRVVTQFRSSPNRSLAYLKMGQTYFGLGQYDKAIAAYQNLAANFVNSPEAKEAQYQIMQCYYNKGDLQGAFTQFAVFQKAYPADERLRDACQMILAADQNHAGGVLHPSQLASLLKACPASQVGATILWQRGADLFNTKQYAAAQKYFQRIIVSYPNDEFAPQAYFYTAECYFHLQRMEDAAAAYKSFTLNYPADHRAPQAMFQVGVSLFNQKEFVKAAEAFGAYLQKFPQGDMARDASLNVALCTKKAFKLNDAIQAYQNYLQAFPKDSKEGFVRLQIGTLYAQLGKFNEAVQEFKRVPEGSAERMEALYRQAKACKEMHQDAETRSALEQLVPLRPKNNEFRIAGLMDLAEIREASADKAGLRALYRDIAESTDNAEIRASAQQRLKDLP